MTTVDVQYRYGVSPTEQAVLGIARLREVYGIRGVKLNEVEKTVWVEYDSTRLSEQVVHQLLRRGGLDITEKLALYAPPAPVEAVPAS